MNPLVSIVVPCFNSAPYLEETIDSVINQHFTDWECIIVNDGSTDNTAEIAQALTLKDVRIRLINTPDVGLSGSRNAGIAVSKGKYILPLDGDDKISADYIAACVQAMEADPTLAIVYCEAECFDGKTGRWDLPPFDIKTFASGNIIFCTAMFYKQTWSEVGGYDESLRVGYEDWEFWISVLEKGGTVKKLPMTGFYYRIRSNSLMSKLRSDSEGYAKYNYVLKKHYDFFVEHLGDMGELYRSREEIFRSREEYRAFAEKMQSRWFYKAYNSIKGMLRPR